MMINYNYYYSEIPENIKKYLPKLNEIEKMKLEENQNIKNIYSKNFNEDYKIGFGLDKYQRKFICFNGHFNEKNEDDNYNESLENNIDFFYNQTFHETGVTVLFQRYSDDKDIWIFGNCCYYISIEYKEEQFEKMMNIYYKKVKDSKKNYVWIYQIMIFILIILILNQKKFEKN